MRKYKKLLLLFALCSLCKSSNAQNLNWLVGKWDGIASNVNNSQLIRTIVIDSVSGENFSGTRINELKGHGNARIVTSLSGRIDKDQVYLKTGTVLYKKEPPNGQWMDCSSCTPEIKISIQNDKIIVTSIIAGCQTACNSTSVYYKLLCDFDTSTQHYLINSFGTSADIRAFKPCIKKSPEQIAAEKKREQEITDSLNFARQKEQQHIKDSVANATALAKKRQKEIDDSISIARKHQLQIQDSITTANNIARQKEQQRLKDSVANAAALAKKRQKEIDHSISVLRKNQLQIQDSITTANNIALQKEQQRLKDSVANAAALATRRQKEIDDSISLAKKYQQHVQDSITTANNITKQKEQQRLKDSVANAAALAKRRQKEIDDSLSIAKKYQQHVQDSKTTANNIAKQKEQQHIKDSVANAAALAKVKTNAPAVRDTAKTSTKQAFETRDNVLLETYHITTPDILIELFDNAQIDGDRVSVYHNNSLIVNNQTLLRDPITIKIHADAADRTHEFIMIAENLGGIPPNTALMRVTAGDKVYKLSVKTDLKTNAKIVFQYDGN
jgi:hypothetical protein